jgi:3-oxoacyl-[acyl-carrier protein] reductase
MSDRIVLVTGGNRGIGRATALAFAAQGDRVIVGCRSGTSPDGLVAVAMDVADRSSVDAAFDTIEAEHGAVEVLIANAGITRDTLLMRMDDDDLESVLQTNLLGAIRCARRSLRGMLKAKRGCIVFTSSVVWATGSAGQVNYAAAKAGLVGAARSLAREVGSRGIRVNVLAPGFVTTEMTEGLPEERRAEILGQIPLARYGSPDAIAAATVALCGPAGAYITGAVIPVDGGLGLGH